MNINTLFKFKRYPSRYVLPPTGVESFDVIHRDSDDTVMDVTRMAGGYWQAHRNGKTFDARTRAAAVWGLADRDLGLLTLHLQEIAKCHLTGAPEMPSVRVPRSYRK
jgi:hypothetical protein